MDDREKAVNELRALSARMISNAKSGHTGACLSSAPIVFALFQDHMNFNTKDTGWLMRDRFIMSIGHASALLYAVSNMYGFDYSIDDLKNFRKLHSKCSGHPEVFSPNVEASTGLLGQGIANAVGMALSEKKLRDLSHLDSENNFDYSHYTYVLAGEGDLSEGISYEACSLAGLWKLSHLIILLDHNQMTIEGKMDLAFCENLTQRFESQGFFVQVVEDGNDTKMISEAILSAKMQDEKPSIIICKTKLGFGSKFENDERIHGKALLADELEDLENSLQVNTSDWKFSKSTKNLVNESLKKKKEYYNECAQGLKEFLEKDIFQDINFDAIKEKVLNQNWFYDISTREASHKILNAIKDDVPNLLGGSADLAPSTKSYFENEPYFSHNNIQARNIHYGVREHAMGAITNGICLYGVYRAFASTFLVFSDYLKPSIRMSAMMKINPLYLFTHDSFLVGEDGPTHHPIEQLTALREIPNMIVFRPCDMRETVAGYLTYLQNNDKPTALILSRQDLLMNSTDIKSAMDGGYVLEDSPLKNYDITLIASGSEVQICTDIRAMLFEKGYNARVVSMPSVELFEKKSIKYKKSVLGDAVRVFIEFSNDDVYNLYMRSFDTIFNLKNFTKSGSAKDLLEYYGLSAEKLYPKIEKIVKAYKKHNKTLLN